MKKIVNTLSTASLIIYSFACPVFSGNRTVSYNDTKTAGMGDTKVAGGFNYNGFVDNPALLSRVRNVRFSLVRLPMAINSHLFEISNFVYYNKYNFENFNNLQSQGKEIFLNAFSDYEGKWGYVNVSPMIDFAVSYHQHSIGIAAFTINEFGIMTGRLDNQPCVWGKGFARKVYVAGYARPVTFLHRGFIIGMNLKFIERRRVNTFQIKTSDLGSLSEISGSIGDEFAVKNKTFAVDLGTLWYIPSLKSEVGVTFQSIGDGRGASFDVGIVKQLLWKKLILLADYRDLLDNNRENILEKIHVGTELSYDVFSVRAGFNSGYFSYGFGMNFKLVHLDVAFYSVETGIAPDIYKDKRMKGQVKLGW